MKKSVNNLAAIKAIVPTQFEIATAQTSTGKPCLAIITDKRLSLDDFKAFMNNVRLLDGFGFTKYLPEFKGSFICVTGEKVSKSQLHDLAASYTWNVKEPKKATPAKTPNNKKELTAKKTAKEDMKADSLTELSKLEQFARLKKELGL